jgi:outer membrane receptor protein involved in Fe transport
LRFVWNISDAVDLTIDYWAIDYEDRIEAESAQVLLNTNPYAASVTRNQFGELIAVSTSYFNELFFRGSIGTSFTTPSMAQMFSSEIQLGSVRDVDDSPFVRLALLGNKDLKPATSENMSFGFVWYISDAVDLTIDYWAIDYEDRIEAESAQVLLNTNPYAASVTRNQFGELIAVSTSYFNELFFRGSIGTSFTTPSMAQMFSSEIQLGSVRDVHDSPFVRLALLGNKDLKPATSENMSFGFVWYISDAVDLTIDYWAIDYEDRIEAESAQVLLNTNPYAASVTRNQFGELIAVSTSYFNELFFRGSIGTSFTTPSMAQMFSSEIQLGSVRDVDDSPFVRLALLGNKDLKPATSENMSFGFVWYISDAVDLTMAQ